MEYVPVKGNKNGLPAIQRTARMIDCRSEVPGAAVHLYNFAIFNNDFLNKFLHKNILLLDV